MFVKFQKRESFKVAGINVKTSMKTASVDCPSAWDKFNPFCQSMESLKNKNEYFGICNAYNQKEGTFSYMACTTVNENDDVKGLDTLEIPAANYAVFKHQGALCDISKTYDEIFQKWMPSSGYMYDPNGNDFELYNEEFDCKEEKNCILYICIPVVKASK